MAEVHSWKGGSEGRRAWTECERGAMKTNQYHGEENEITNRLALLGTDRFVSILYRSLSIQSGEWGGHVGHIQNESISKYSTKSRELGFTHHQADQQDVWGNWLRKQDCLISTAAHSYSSKGGGKEEGSREGVGREEGGRREGGGKEEGGRREGGREERRREGGRRGGGASA